MRTAEEVQAFFLKEFGKMAKTAMKGPHKSLLLFYLLGKHSVIVQVFHGGGWDAYATDGGNKVEDTLQWLRRMAQG